MNLLEHYIKEVHGIKESSARPEWIEVDVTTDCWGDVRRTTHITTKKQWEQDLERGYFMA